MRPPTYLHEKSRVQPKETLITVQKDFCNKICHNRTHAHRSKQHRYSITLSATASSVGGIARPSALAVFMLMLSTSLVGNSTGKSAGLAPFRWPQSRYRGRQASLSSGNEVPHIFTHESLYSQKKF